MLVIDEEQAENVRLIFNLYLQGYSIGGIIKELEKREIKSPTGKDKCYLSQDNHLPIIAKSIFYAVKLEKEKRCSVIETESGKQRKSTK